MNHIEHDIETASQYDQKHDVSWHTAIDDLEPQAAPEHEPLDVAGIGQVPLDAIKVFILMLLPANVTPNLPSYWRSAACRLAALAHALQIQGPGEMSLQQLGDALGCSRALLSLNQVGIRDYAKLGRVGGGKTNQARDNYAESARKAWRKSDRKQRHDSRRNEAGGAVAQ